MDIEHLLARVVETVRAASRIMLEAENSPAHEKEGHYNFVTDADLQVQEKLISELGLLLPEAEFFAEEKENQQLGKGLTFIIDPIDGTLNFMHGRNCSAISVGLMLDAQPLLGVIYNPYRDEMFTAIKGKGAFLNGWPVHVSENPFEHAMVAFGTSPYNAELAPRTFKIAAEFLRQAGDLRRCGSAALDLCDVACGRSDVYYEMILSPWDFAAGSLIVMEAGGHFVMPGEGGLRENDYGRPGFILASNDLCFEPAVKIATEN